jgi:hypothetical protein
MQGRDRRGALARVARNPRLSKDSSEKPPFLPILGYVLGFMVLLGVLAFLVALLLHSFQR